MQVRWPAVGLVLGTIFLVWALTKLGASVATGLGRLFEALLRAAERDPVFALGLLGMAVITVLGCIRILTNSRR